MQVWYYHDPDQGRVGPCPAEEVRRRFRDRRIQRDTPVWREGLAGWVPLAQVAAELDLDPVTPDTLLPPPLPPAASATSGRAARPAAPPQRRMSGCLIALLVGVGLAVPLVGILAAIAVPAYDDYTVRARVAATVAQIEATPLKAAIAGHLADDMACPDNASADIAAALRQLAQSAHVEAVHVGTLEGGTCAFEVTLRGIGAQADGRTVLFEARRAGDQFDWDCSGGDLPARFRPRQCRPTQKDPT